MSNPQPEKVRVVVGDDHPLFREGVVRALSLSGSVNVVGEADDGAAALELIKAHLPDVALLDYRMPGMDGAQVAAAVRSYELPTRVLLISAHDEPAIVYQALQQGAAGFLLKDSTRTEIVKAVLDCAKGRDVVAPSLVGGLAGEIRQRAAPVAPVLSAREREVLNRIACRQSIPAIAAERQVEGTIAVPGGRVWFQRIGGGPGRPLLVVHGGPGLPHNYLAPLRRLSDEREVIFWDQLGCGNSACPSDVEPPR